MALDRSTRRTIRALLVQGIGRMVASEALAYDLLSQSVEQATDTLVARIVAAGDDQRMVQQEAYRAISAGAAALELNFGSAADQAIDHARNLGLGQVRAELESAAELARSLPEGSGLGTEPPVVRLATDTVERDALAAAAAGRGMAQRWSQAAIAAVTTWRSEQAPASALAARLNGIRGQADAHARLNAVVVSTQAYNDERRAAWDKLVPPKPKGERGQRRARASSEPVQARGDGGPDLRLIPGGRDDGMLPSGPEEGLPYGWGQGLFEIWSAVLDRATCPRCYELDGNMVPKGKQFSAGQPPIHLRCRCELVVIFVPKALSRKLPGIQIDYASLKDDVRDYMRGRSAKKAIGEGVRHAPGFIEEALRGRPRTSPAVKQRGSSPEALTRRLLEPQKYFPNRVQQRAPRVGGIR